VDLGHESFHPRATIFRRLAPALPASPSRRTFTRPEETHQEPGGRVIVQIFSNTPAWVFVLLFVLLAFGVMQTRTRSVRRFPALLLPAGMIVLSLAGINSSFGLMPVPLAAWAVALAIAAVVGYALFRDRRVEFDATEQKFFVPGSWMPLVVIMAIFFTKYVYAVMRALNADVISTPAFVVALSTIYGLLSGYFAARAFNLIKTAQRVPRLV
jgi:hypothetical protein